MPTLSNGSSETLPAPVDSDRYCLKYGYNLRGLSGDPVRRPECGDLNPLERLLGTPADLDRRRRELQTAVDVCALAALP